MSDEGRYADETLGHKVGISGWAVGRGMTADSRSWTSST
jgi:hypothetical protein